MYKPLFLSTDVERERCNEIIQSLREINRIFCQLLERKNQETACFEIRIREYDKRYYEQESLINELSQKLRELRTAYQRICLN